MSTTTRVTLRIPADLAQQVDLIAREKGISLNSAYILAVTSWVGPPGQWIVRLHAVRKGGGGKFR